MPNTTATLAFLPKHPRYEIEKPYVIVPSADNSSIKDSQRTNVEVEKHDNILIRDINNCDQAVRLGTHGFEVLQHKTQYPVLDELSQCKAYKRETAELLKKHFDAECVITWDLKKRHVTEYTRGGTWDYNDPRQSEGPAVMAHCDYTFDSGLVMINAHLTAEEKLKYLNEKFRIRLVNTWRPMVAVVAHQPLALCDTRSVLPNSLVACDRVLCNLLGEVYLLQHHPDQEWYWLEGQTPDQPFLFLTWDSASDGKARYCPHLSFANGKAGSHVPERKSVETRSIVITRVKNEG